MGIDWEEILDAEGADMAEAYNNSLPEERYESTEASNHDSLEDEEEPVDDWIGEPEDGPYAMTRDELIDECLYCYDWMHTLRYNVDLARQDIKTLMDLLKEHGIQVPEDIIEKNWTLEDDDMEVSAEEPVKVEDDEEAKRQALEEAKRQAILEQCKIKEKNMVVQSIPSNMLEDFDEFEDFDE